MKRKYKDDEEEITWELSVPSEKLQDYSLLLYGEKKIGKTTLASRFPDVAFLMCEPGGKAVAIHQRPIHNWNEFVDHIRWFRKHPSKFRTIVVDTVDLCYKMCQAYKCAKLGIDHPSDEAYGKGWEQIRDEFHMRMAEIQSLGRGVIFISHANQKEVEMQDGSKLWVTEPSMAPAAYRTLVPMIDMWFYYGYKTKEGGQQLWIKGTAEVAAGHRVKGHFVGVRRIDMGSNEDEAYANFIAAWNQQKVEVKRKQKVKSSRVGRVGRVVVVGR